ncbi:MAG: SGNH/GDSL hydrolase family protein [Deltaproteobacteria bacterium]|nr:SGNH/GDSL hydrolase family protein [Deltaproteobacteria bacterium]
MSRSLPGFPILITLLGMVIIIIAVATDWLIGGTVGFGLLQTLLATVGAVILLIGLLLYIKGKVNKALFYKLTRFYQNVALLFFNTVILLLGLNCLLWAGGVINPDLIAYPPPVPETEMLPVYRFGPAEQFDFKALHQVYPDRSDYEISRLIMERWNVPLVCDPDTLYHEKPFQGYFITVSPDGFRLVENQGPWPPYDDAYNIFVFGGSTTFGYGESNGQTIPSYLQKHLTESLDKKIFVYNFGHGFFFSLQERWAFEALLRDGFVPDLAIFIDGLNDFYHWDGQPTLLPCSDPLSAVERVRNTFNCRGDEWCWPIQRLTTRLNIAAKLGDTEPIENVSPPPYDDAATNTDILDRWLENKQLIEEVAEIHNIETLFVMQPVPGYAYNVTYHPFVQDDLSNLDYQLRSHWGYALWEERAAADDDEKWTSNFLNLARLSENKQIPLYVDRVHYTGTFANEIAQNIAKTLLAKQIIQ